MKKIYSLFVALIFGIPVLFAGGISCTPDTNNTAILSPRPDSLPCIVRTEFYNEPTQMAIPDSINVQDFIPAFPFPYTVYIDSLVIDSVTGFPEDIHYLINPMWRGTSSAHLYGGDHACNVLYGTTTDSTGEYPITFHGTITFHGAPIIFVFDGDTTMKLEDLGDFFKGNLMVINPGDSCPPETVSSIKKDFSSALNTALSIYPNPNNGQFELKLDAGRKINGDIVITDITGRVVYSEKLNLLGYYSTSINLSSMSKGLYTLQLRTAEGFASKRISIE